MNCMYRTTKKTNKNKYHTDPYTETEESSKRGLGAMVSLFFLKALYKSATYTARSFCTVGHRCDLRRMRPLSIFQEHRLKERQRTQRHFFSSRSTVRATWSSSRSNTHKQTKVEQKTVIRSTHYSRWDVKVPTIADSAGEGTRPQKKKKKEQAQTTLKFWCPLDNSAQPVNEIAQKCQELLRKWKPQQKRERVCRAQ